VVGLARPESRASPGRTVLAAYAGLVVPVLGIGLATLTVSLRMPCSLRRRRPAVVVAVVLRCATLAWSARGLNGS